MKNINFLCISLCLFLNISTTKPMVTMKLSQRARPFLKRLYQGVNPSKNPLMSVNSYRNKDENFTLAVAKCFMSREKGYLVNNPGTAHCRPLEWVCLPDSTAEFSLEERLKIVNFFLEHGANKKSIEKALSTCSDYENYNSKIIPIISRHRSDQTQLIKNEEPEASPLGNPLANMRIYRDEYGNFTLNKAINLMNEDDGYLVNCPEDSADLPLSSRPLGLICSRPLNQEEQLKIVKLFLENGANENSIYEALLVCWENRDCNLKVIKLLRSHETEYSLAATKDITPLLIMAGYFAFAPIGVWVFIGGIGLLGWQMDNVGKLLYKLGLISIN